MGRTPWEILKEADEHPDEIVDVSRGHGFHRGRPDALLQSWDRMSVQGVEDPAEWTFAQRMRHYGNSVRTVPLEWKGEVFLVALRSRHTIDYTKVARTLGVRAEEIGPADESLLRERLGFQAGFETLVTDQPVTRYVDLRVTWMRSATITTGTSDLAAVVTPTKLLALTEAAVGDFAAEPVPLDEAGWLPSGSTRTLASTEAVLREVSGKVGFPLWVPDELVGEGRRFQLQGADWSAGLASPANMLDRATLRLSMQPGDLTLILDESPNPAHHELAKEAWPNLIEAGLHRPWLTTLLQLERGNVGITLVASEDFTASARAIRQDFPDDDFPHDLEVIAQALVPYPT